MVISPDLFIHLFFIFVSFCPGLDVQERMSYYGEM